MTAEHIVMTLIRHRFYSSGLIILWGCGIRPIITHMLCYTLYERFKKKEWRGGIVF